MKGYTIQLTVGYLGAVCFLLLAAFSGSLIEYEAFASYLVGILAFICGSQWSKSSEGDSVKSLFSVAIAIAGIIALMFTSTTATLGVGSFGLCFMWWMDRGAYQKKLVSIAYYRFRTVASLSACISAAIVLLKITG